jgi:pimeloyl-ACP methyl ester carboxylesterase
LLDTFVLPSTVHPLARGLGVQTDSIVMDGLGAIGCPTLLLVGGKDRRFLPAQKYLERAIPDARSLVIPGAGHAVHRSNGTEMKAAILTFLERPDCSRRIARSAAEVLLSPMQRHDAE